MNIVKFSTAVILAGLIFSACTVSPSYDNYTWDGTAYTDADSDGIPDVAEKEGTSFYDMPLYDWGARPGTPDLFIHIAPMVAGIDSYGYPDAGMLLQKKALDRVVAAFAAQGIALHFDVGKRRLYDGYTEITGRDKTSYNLSGKDHSVPYTKSIALDTYSGTDSSFSFVDDLKYKYFPSNRLQIFYFMVMGSSQNADGSSGSSGVAWPSGIDFLITLANWDLFFGELKTSTGTIIQDQNGVRNNTVNHQASTIMHEFGHNLGLGHGGFEATNYKPNYVSIMNYLYQLNGLPKIGSNEGDRYYYSQYYSNPNDKYNSKWLNFISKYPWDLENSSYSDTYNMDYSYGFNGLLKEDSLNENVGLNYPNLTDGIDWNGNGTKTDNPIKVNINPYYAISSSAYDTSDTSSFSDYNDWGHLYFYYAYTAHGEARSVEKVNTVPVLEKNSSLKLDSDIIRNYKP